MRHHLVAAIPIALGLSIATTMLYTASLYCILRTIAEDSPRRQNEPRADAQEFFWSNNEVALNFTNELPAITSDKAWAFPQPKVFRLHPQSGTEYTISMYQQLHCLDRIRIAYLSYHDTDRPKLAPSVYEQAEVCLEQLRQIMLCNADLTLESTKPVIGADGKVVPAVTGLGVIHRCLNWRELESQLN